jgi:HSP20 family protein
MLENKKETVMNNLTTRNRELLPYDPFRDLLGLESLFPPEFVRPARSLPAVNISEDEKCYNVDIVAPGFKKEDFKVNVQDDMLTISAETKAETSEQGDNKQYNRREYSYSSFTRSFQLPDNAKDDNISANYSEGVLKLTIPKSEQPVKATKEISIH